MLQVARARSACGAVPRPNITFVGSNMSGAADIGIDFRTDETGCFQITDMKPSGPAAVSGRVDLGDILYEIDGVKVLYGIGPNGRPLSNIEIMEMLRGPEGSVLNLRLQKGRRGRLAQVNLTRTSGPAYAQQQQQQQQVPSSAQRQGPPSMTGLYGTQQSQFSQDAAAPQYSSQDASAQHYASHEQTPYAHQYDQQGQGVDHSYAERYNPEQPDRLGLGLVFKPYGPSRPSIALVAASLHCPRRQRVPASSVRCLC
jgi:hypothetical protein